MIIVNITKGTLPELLLRLHKARTARKRAELIKKVDAVATSNKLADK